MYAELFVRAQQHCNVASWQCVLGALHHGGRGGAKQDFTLAAQWWERAADQGHARAQSALGACFADGDGVAKDNARAAQFYQLSADQGHALAQHRLGVCYRDGKGVAKNESKALELFRLSAALGNENAKTAVRDAEAAKAKAAPTQVRT